jgi:hypothetical protein
MEGMLILYLLEFEQQKSYPYSKRKVLAQSALHFPPRKTLCWKSILMQNSKLQLDLLFGRLFYQNKLVSQDDQDEKTSMCSMRLLNFE